jgi:hypothetical protein
VAAKPHPRKQRGDFHLLGTSHFFCQKYPHFEEQNYKTVPNWLKLG